MDHDRFLRVPPGINGCPQQPCVPDPHNSCNRAKRVETPFWAAAVAVGSGCLKPTTHHRGLNLGDPTTHHRGSNLEDVENKLQIWCRDVALQLANVCADVTSLRRGLFATQEQLNDLDAIVQNQSKTLPQEQDPLAATGITRQQAESIELLRDEIKKCGCDQVELKQAFADGFRALELQTTMAVNRTRAAEADDTATREAALRFQITQEIKELHVLLQREHRTLIDRVVRLENFSLDRNGEDQRRDIDMFSTQLRDAHMQLADLNSKSKQMAQWFQNESKLGRSVLAHLNDDMETLKKGHSDMQEGLQECRNIWAATRHAGESFARVSSVFSPSQNATRLCGSSCIVSDTIWGDVDVAHVAASQPNTSGDAIASQPPGHQNDRVCAARSEDKTYCTCKESLDAVATEQEKLRVFVIESIAKHLNSVKMELAHFKSANPIRCDGRCSALHEEASVMDSNFVCGSCGADPTQQGEVALQMPVSSDSRWCTPLPAQTADTKYGGAPAGQSRRVACFRFKRFPFRWGSCGLKVTPPRRK